MEWIKSITELPPSDGYYEINNNPNELGSFTGIAYYDGIGFMVNGTYRPAAYWKPWIKPEKRYGEQDGE